MEIPAPEHTSIQLTKSKDKLDIYIPARRRARWDEIMRKAGCAVIFVFSAGIVFPIVIVILILISQPSLATIQTLLFMLFLASGIVLLIYPFVVAETFVSIDVNNVTITKKAFKIRLEYQQCKTSNIFDVGIGMKRRRIWKNVIVIRSNKGMLFLRSALTDRESAWLVQEIRDWLNLR